MQIENFFYFSVLVKNPPLGTVFLGADEEPYMKVYAWRDTAADDGPGRSAIDYGSDEDAEADAAAGLRGRKSAAPPAPSVDFKSKQFAVQIDLGAWAKVRAAYELARPVLPHRHSADSTAPASFAFAARAPAPAPVGAAHDAGAAPARKTGRARAGAKRRATEAGIEEEEV